MTEIPEQDPKSLIMVIADMARSRPPIDQCLCGGTCAAVAGIGPCLGIVAHVDGAIVNPLDKRMMGCIKAAEMLIGSDAYRMNYLKAYRAVRLAW